MPKGKRPKVAGACPVAARKNWKVDAGDELPAKMPEAVAKRWIHRGWAVVETAEAAPNPEKRAGSKGTRKAKSAKKTARKSK